MGEIQRKLVKWGKRNVVSRRFHARNDEEMIATWRLGLDKILQVFNVRSVIRAMTSVNFSLPEGTHNERKCSRFCRSPQCHQHPHWFRRPGCGYLCHSFRHSSRHIEQSRGYARSGSESKHHLYSTRHRVTTYRCLGSRQVSGIDHR